MSLDIFRNPGGLDRISQLRNDRSMRLTDPHSGLRGWFDKDYAPDAEYSFIRTVGSKELDASLMRGTIQGLSHGLLELFHQRVAGVMGDGYYTDRIVRSHSVEADPFMPQMHLLRGSSCERIGHFNGAIGSLLTHDSLNWCFNIDQSNNKYNEKKLRYLLKNTNQALSLPLLKVGDWATLSGSQLKAVIDTLMPYSYKHEDNSGYSD